MSGGKVADAPIFSEICLFDFYLDRTFGFTLFDPACLVMSTVIEVAILIVGVSLLFTPQPVQ
jgi:hypothetical protein